MTIPALGQHVTYRMSGGDAVLIQERRAAAPAARRGNTVHEGDEFPAIVVRVFTTEPPAVNLQVLLDGDDSYWATSRTEGNHFGQYRVPEQDMTPILEAVGNTIGAQVFRQREASSEAGALDDLYPDHTTAFRRYKAEHADAAAPDYPLNEVASDPADSITWNGGADNATGVINWVIVHGGTARYVGEGESHYLRWADTDRAEFIAVPVRHGTHRLDVGDTLIYTPAHVQNDFAVTRAEQPVSAESEPADTDDGVCAEETSVARVELNAALRLLGLHPDDPERHIVSVEIERGWVKAVYQQHNRIGGTR